MLNKQKKNHFNLFHALTSSMFFFNFDIIEKLLKLFLKCLAKIYSFFLLNGVK